MPNVIANTSFLIQLKSFHNLDLYQRGYYQIRFFFKSGNSPYEFTNYKRNSVAIYPPKLFDDPLTDNTSPSVIPGQTTNTPILPSKGCSGAFLVMYHKESVNINNSFYQDVRVNVDASNVEDIFNQSELYFCAELWFSEDSPGKQFQFSDMECISARNLRINFSPTRGLNHHFLVFFDYLHLCAVEIIIHGYLTSFLPGIHKVQSIAHGLSTISSFEALIKTSWKDFLFFTRHTSSYRHYPMFLHRHLCQALLSAHERMITFWHEISIFFSDEYRSQIELSDSRSLLDNLTNAFQDLDSEESMADAMSIDINFLATRNDILFRQISEFVTSTVKVQKHLQRKSHHIRMKRFAEAFFCQELPIEHLMAMYDPSSASHHECGANIVLQSLYFQRLPELPVFSRELDGDCTNTPIIFEDVFLPADSSVEIQQTSELINHKCDIAVINSLQLSYQPETISLPPTVSLTSLSKPAQLDENVETPQSSGEINENRNYSPGFWYLEHLNSTEASIPSSKQHQYPFVRSIVHQTSHTQRRNRLLARQRARSTVLPLEKDGVSLLGFRRITDVDDFVPASLVHSSSSTVLIQNNQRKSTFYRNFSPFTLPIGRHLTQQSKYSSSSVSLSAIDRDMNQMSTVPSISRWKLKHAKSTPNLDKTVRSCRFSSNSVALGSLRNRLLTIPPCDDVFRCSKCGLPDWSIRSRDPLLSNLSVSLPSIASMSMDDDIPRRNSPFSDPGFSKSASARKIKFRRNNSKWASRIRKYHVSSQPTAVYSEDLARLGSCNDLGEGGTDSCHCVPNPRFLQECSTNTSPCRPTRFNNDFKNTTSTPNGQNNQLFPHSNSAIHNVISEENATRCPFTKVSQSNFSTREINTETSLIDAPEPNNSQISLSTFETSLDEDLNLADWLMIRHDSISSEIKMILPKRSSSSSCIRESPIICSKSSHYSADGRDKTNSNASSKLLSFSKSSDRLVDAYAPGTMTFVFLKENLKRELAPHFVGNLYSDFSQLSVPHPYFSNPPSTSTETHLIICVHGLDGNSTDLRLVAVYLQLALPDCGFEFLMAESNSQNTFSGFDVLADKLVVEILDHLERMEEKPSHISFIGHSLGCVLIRSALASPRLRNILPLLHTFLSLCGPHLGTLYGTSGLVNMGMWALQKLKKSHSLLQLRLRDNIDLRETYMYKLSSAPGLGSFRYVLLVASPQDYYVPHHSSRIEMCKAAVADNSDLGQVFVEMVVNLLQRFIKDSKTTVVRYDIYHPHQSSANSFIGRAAHIAVLDSDVLLERFFSVSAAKYFRCDNHVD